MKKYILIFILISFCSFGESELYKKVTFLDGEVYFPKTTSEYIDSLLKDKSIESYAKLTTAYYNLGNDESMKKYFDYIIVPICAIVCFIMCLKDQNNKIALIIKNEMEKERWQKNYLRKRMYSHMKG